MIHKKEPTRVLFRLAFNSSSDSEPSYFCVNMLVGLQLGLRTRTGTEPGHWERGNRAYCTVSLSLPTAFLQW